MILMGELVGYLSFLTNYFVLGYAMLVYRYEVEYQAIGKTRGALGTASTSPNIYYFSEQ